MPEIARELTDSVVILLSETKRPVGTGFVVEHIDANHDFFRSFYLVTCEHCAELKLRARFSTGALLDVEQTAWTRSVDEDDVVALDITDFVTGAGKGVGSINIGRTVRRDEAFFGVGCDLYMLGLLVDDEDVGANLPIARFGNLSAVATPRLPREMGNGKKRPCHLADMRSRSGFSGSPVIAYTESAALSGGFVYNTRLLGIHSAQHQETVKAVSHSQETLMRIPSSMTRIVPAWAIASLIEDSPALIAQRNERKYDVGGQLGVKLERPSATSKMSGE